MNAPDPRIALVQIAINSHAPIFDNLLDSMEACLRESGRMVHRMVNQLAESHLHILTGATAFAAQALLPQVAGHRFVVFQMEPLHDERGLLPGTLGYRDLMERAECVWDYSAANLAWLERQGFRRLAHVRPGYHPALEKVPQDIEKDIDVFFFGATTERRVTLLQKLKDAGLKVVIAFGCYGEERNRLIARSRIIVNIHQHDGLDILEEVRLSFLLSNRCFVVSEKSDCNPYGAGVVFASYEDVVDTCVFYARADPALRDAVALKGFEAIRATPLHGQLIPAVASLQHRKLPRQTDSF